MSDPETSTRLGNIEAELIRIRDRLHDWSGKITAAEFYFDQIEVLNKRQYETLQTLSKIENRLGEGSGKLYGLIVAVGIIVNALFFLGTKLL